MHLLTVSCKIFTNNSQTGSKNTAPVGKKVMGNPLVFASSWGKKKNKF